MARVRLDDTEVTRKGSAYPQQFPALLVDDALDITKCEAWFDRAADLGKAVWELNGFCSRYIFGDPENRGKRPERIDLIPLLPKLKLLDSRLRTALQILKSPATLTGANVDLLDLNEAIVLIECCIRILRLVQSVNTQPTKNGEAPNPLAPSMSNGPGMRDLRPMAQQLAEAKQIVPTAPADAVVSGQEVPSGKAPWI